jgi:hypothetical protein
MVVVEENRKPLISLISPIGGGAIRAGADEQVFDLRWLLQYL